MLSIEQKNGKKRNPSIVSKMEDRGLLPTIYCCVYRIPNHPTPPPPSKKHVMQSTERKQSYRKYSCGRLENTPASSSWMLFDWRNLPQVKGKEIKSSILWHMIRNRSKLLFVLTLFRLGWWWWWCGGLGLPTFNRQQFRIVLLVFMSKLSVVTFHTWCRLDETTFISKKRLVSAASNRQEKKIKMQVQFIYLSKNL